MVAMLMAALVAFRLAMPEVGVQAAASADPLTEVRQTVAAARKALDAYAASGGKAGAPDHPALTWEAMLWAYRDKYPGTGAAAIASAEAVRVLFRAELWDRAHARAGSVGVDDQAWERLATVIYEEGIARKDLPYTIETVSRVERSTTRALNKAAALVVIGRAYRRQGDKEAATRALEAAKAAAPDSLYADEAVGLIYEIAHLSVGLPAPAIDGTTRDGRRVTLADFRGKPVVLVFWGTT
jgi:hypothetical protein